MKDFAWWLNTLFSGIDEKMDRKEKEGAFEKCGRACFQSCGLTDSITDLKNKTSDLGELLTELNKAGIGGGNLKLEGEKISGVYEKCYCPYRNALGESISPDFCNCTKGWTKSLLENVLDKSVEVELVQSIGRGDKVCRFEARLD